jgi:NADH-quinone oxidoreductase subunit L
MRGRAAEHVFFSFYLITLGMVNGAVLADNIILLLFFWEGLLLTLFGMIAIAGGEAYLAATKAFIIVGISDLCMMFGAGLAVHLSGAVNMSGMHLSLEGPASLAFVFLMIGAISKAGSVPFHSWIPDAAQSASLPFMALLPASLEKLLGIYFLARLCLDMFSLSADSWISVLLMVVGSVTIVLAVLMALIQKEYKKLLSYHAISQVGYMILGIGTAVPAGVIGGLFHMVNHAMYKSCLFLTAGSVERQAGTTDLEKLGGAGRRMPVTFACFIVTAAAISGVPPLNGFYSKELVYDAALSRHTAFYVAAILGSFFTAASFLKLGHAVYLGKAGEAAARTREAPAPMLVPMVIIAALCALFGLFYDLPIATLVQPVVEGSGRYHGFTGMPHHAILYIVTLAVLAAALVNHVAGARVMGSGLKAVDHIQNAPGLAWAYARAENRYFDPYNIFRTFADAVSLAARFADRINDWMYERLPVSLAGSLSRRMKALATGNLSSYIIWSMLGALGVILYFLR